MGNTPFGPIGTAGTFQYKVSQILGGRTDTGPAAAIKDGLNYALREIDRRFDHVRFMRHQRYETMAQSNTLVAGTDFTNHASDVNLFYVDLSGTLTTPDTVIWKVLDEDSVALTEVATFATLDTDGQWFFDTNMQILYIMDDNNDLEADTEDQTYYVKNRYSLDYENTRKTTIATGSATWTDKTGGVYSATLTNPPHTVYQDDGTDVELLTHTTDITPSDGEWYWQTGTLYIGDTTNNLTSQADRDVYAIHRTELAVKSILSVRRQDSDNEYVLPQLSRRDFDLGYPYSDDVDPNEPGAYVHLDDYLEITPPGSSTYTIDVRYSLFSPELVNDYDTILYDRFDDIIVALATAYAYNTLQEEDSGTHWTRIAEKRLAWALQSERTQPDQMLLHKGYRNMGSRGVPLGTWWTRFRGWW